MLVFAASPKVSLDGVLVMCDMLLTELCCDRALSGTLSKGLLNLGMVRGMLTGRVEAAAWRGAVEGDGRPVLSLRR